MGYPTSNRGRLPPNTQRQIERLQGLVDDRGSTIESDRNEQLAVTRGDLAGFGTVELKSAYAAGAAPTAAEHDALVDDLRTLAAILNKIGGDVRW